MKPPLRTASWAAGFFLAATLFHTRLDAQRGGGPAPAPPPPKLAAPFDITGSWVAIVSEDWRYRMMTPPKGDYASVPMNGAARRIADAWDPARDEAAGEQCKSYGVGGIMRLPTRLRIHWQDDETVVIETDAGTQTRTIAFGRPRSQGGDWQGASVATWDRSASVIGGLFGGAGGRGGSLRVVTTKMKPGYLRKNGVPYSAEAVVTEHFDRFELPNGDVLLLVSTEVVDPTYLAQPYWTSTHFKKQNDTAAWNPTPCVAR